MMTKNDLLAFFKTDRAILILSISIAFVFWMLVKMSHKYRTVHSLPVQYDIPLGKSFLSTPPQKIDVTFYGKGWDLLSNFFYTSSNYLLLSLSESPTQNISREELKDKIKRLTPSLEVEDIDQNDLQIVLEDLSIKKVPVVLEQQLEFENPFQLRDSVLIEPDSINLQGPSSIVNSIQSWKTKPLIKKNIKANFQEQLSLEPSFNAQLLLEQQEVKITGTVEQFTKKSFFLPVQVKNAPDSLTRIYPEKVKLSCVVGLSKYKELDSDNFELEVQLAGVTPNTENNTAAITLSKRPDYVKAINFSPKSVVFYFGDKE